MSQLNFACLIRVSTERQQKRGESLETQKKQLEQSVKALNGSVYRWFSGMEHATVDEERKILDSLMDDAENKLFDAVMVADVSRWSRDNRQSKRDLDILKKHGIRFFVQTKEYDLFSPDAALYLGLSTEIHEFFGLEQARKSLLNRIERAKKGYPAAGNQPFGRRFNREKEEWEVIEKDKTLMEKMADAYLDGSTFAQLETKFGMRWSLIYKILRTRCGSDWEQTFVSNRLNISETVITKIPALLPEKVIKAIEEKASSRRKWDHATPKHKYLLNRIIFSADTGKPLTGSSRIDPNGTRCRYYSRYDKGTKSLYVRADEIEKSVQDVIYETLGQRRDLRKAVFENPEDGNNNLKTLTEKIYFAKKELVKVEAEVEKATDTLLKSTEDVGVLLQSMNARLKKLNQRHESLTFDLQQSENALKALPEPEEIDDIQRRMELSYFSTGQTFADLPFDEQRKILILLFGGQDENKRRYGVYVKKDGKKKISFEIYGKLGTIRGKLLESIIQTVSGVVQGIFPSSSLPGRL
ncbi:MAG: recombinase family protein [Syntrophobacteraceae bacterium]